MLTRQRDRDGLHGIPGSSRDGRLFVQIHQISIEHFRGIEHGQATFASGVVCLIGPGDSTKSTILDAIEYVLCPNWFIPLDDSDFTNADVTKEIRIDVTVGPVPEDLQLETKYGLHLRGWSLKELITHDDAAKHEDDQPALTIRLRVGRDLTPEWLVVTDRNPEGIRISYRDRQRFRVSRIGANTDNELSWTRGSALLRLAQDTDNAEQTLLDATRKLREICELDSVGGLNTSIEATKKGAESLGLALPSLRVDIDPRSLRANAATLSLHNDKVPARRLGLGTRRLLAIGAQLQAMQEGAVVLIDEIEHALEPHRIKHLIRTLTKLIGGGSGQMIMTSHSPAALEELGAEPLHVVRSSQLTTSITRVDVAAQGTIRTIPDAFLSPRIIVCEGATEIGLLRSYERHILGAKSESFALHGVLPVDGGGSPQVAQRASDLRKHGYDVCLFADSDKCAEWNPSKDELIAAAIEVTIWANDCCTEKRVIDDLPDANALLEFVKAAKNAGASERSIVAGLNAQLLGEKLADIDKIATYSDISVLKKAIYRAAISEGKPWFKTVSRGEMLGDSIFSQVFARMEDTDFFKKITALEAWALAK
jgi:putative ATP-dependent endonuclease of OLD family